VLKGEMVVLVAGRETPDTRVDAGEEVIERTSRD
jgi:hypothetical protein